MKVKEWVLVQSFSKLDNYSFPEAVMGIVTITIGQALTD